MSTEPTPLVLSDGGSIKSEALTKNTVALMAIYATDVAASVAWHDCVATIHIPGLHETWVQKTAEDIRRDLNAVHRRVSTSQQHGVLGPLRMSPRGDAPPSGPTG